MKDIQARVSIDEDSQMDMADYLSSLSFTSKIRNLDYRHLSPFYALKNAILKDR